MNIPFTRLKNQTFLTNGGNIDLHFYSEIFLAIAIELDKTKF